MVKVHFLNKLFVWYKLNKRDLPFRNTQNPYKIWLSEIILQQTRVAQGLPYYYKFIELFPSVKDLAEADEQEILKAWQGLGYYSRARNLHASANIVIKEFGGVFPNSYKELINLKGVGDYTASAISSFSSKEVVPVLDGNVYRFMSRLYGIETFINTPKANKEFKKVLNELIDEENPDIFNQAIIEFGALHCTPSSPNCMECPFNEDCFAFSENRVNEFPVKKKKKKSVERYLSFYRISAGEQIFITKRTENAIWMNLYEFPYFESKNHFDNDLIKDELNDSLKLNNVIGPIKHILSHQNIYAKLFDCEVSGKLLPNSNWEKIRKDELENYPIHRLMEKMLEESIK